MRLIKLTKKDYTDLEGLLNKVGLVEGKEAYPSYLFVNHKTYRQMKKAIFAEFKKHNPSSPKQSIEYAVGLYLLNLGPNILLKKDGGDFLSTGIAAVARRSGALL